MTPHEETPQQEPPKSTTSGGPASKDDSTSKSNSSGGSIELNPLDYDYSSCPLPTESSIRLLHLLPPSSSDPPDTLRCTLSAVPLSMNPTYSAVSYTWGEPVFSHTLYVEDLTDTDTDTDTTATADGGGGEYPSSSSSTTTTSKQIRITPNARALLLQFRHPTEPTVLWIDAICINQHDSAEKSTQIPLMADIYARAAEVLIYLGPSTADSDRAMVFLRRVGREFLNHSGPIREPREDAAADNNMKAIWDDVKSDPALETVHTVWNAPWFGRRWVIQELVFAKKATVHLGGERMSWEELARGVEAMRQLGGDGSFVNEFVGERRRMPSMEVRGAMRIKMLERLRGELRAVPRTTTRSRITTMALAADFECRDDKDRVFSLLGIMNHGREDKFVVHYGLPANEVFERFAWFCLENEHPMDCLDILSYAGLSNPARAGTGSKPGTAAVLPSWVPDWLTSSDITRLPLLNCLSTDMSEELHARIEVRKESKELVISGVYVDPVMLVLPPLSAFSDPERLGWSYTEPDHAAEWYANVEAVFSNLFGPYGFKLPEGIVGEPYTLGGRAWEAPFRAMVLDPPPDELVFMSSLDLPAERRVPSADAFPFYEEGTGFRRQMLTFFAETYGSESSPPRNAPTALTYEGMEYHGRLRSTCEHRSLFVTARGMIGLAPNETEPGDIVCLPAGARVPHVLRPENPNPNLYVNPTTEGASLAQFRVRERNIRKSMFLRATRPRYRLIGECYVQGLMNGEAWKLDHFFMDEFALC